MPKPTATERAQHRDFLLRQKKNENKYLVWFFNHLNKVYSDSAKYIDENGVDLYLKNQKDLLRERELVNIYEDLYKKVTLYEAIYQNDMLLSNVKSFNNSKKDIIDDFASLSSYSSSNNINLWRKLLNDFIEEMIGQRIVEVTQSTVKYVRKIITEGLNDGKGGRDIAKDLRDKGDFNKNRSLVIARTETITAMNKGKYIAALSSKYEMIKRWLPTDDKRTRDSHISFLDSDFIDMDELFEVDRVKGGADVARFPGDLTLSAGNVINCRCSISFRIKTNSSGAPILKK